MPKAELSTHIDRSPEDVFGYVTEFTNNPKWRRNVIDTWWIDEGPTRPGRRGGQAARILGRRMEVTAEIVEWDPPRAASWKTVQGSATLIAYCRVEPEHGGCRLTYGGEGKVNGLLGLLLNPIIKPAMLRGARSDLARLKAALESSATSSVTLR